MSPSMRLSPHSSPSPCVSKAAASADNGRCSVRGLKTRSTGSWRSPVFQLSKLRVSPRRFSRRCHNPRNFRGVSGGEEGTNPAPTWGCQREQRGVGSPRSGGVLVKEGSSYANSRSPALDTPARGGWPQPSLPRSSQSVPQLGILIQDPRSRRRREPMSSGPGKKDRRPAYGGGEARLRISKERRARARGCGAAPAGVGGRAGRQVSAA